MSARDGWMKQVDIKRFHGIMLMKQRQMDEWMYIERKKRAEWETHDDEEDCLLDSVDPFWNWVA